MKITPEVLVDLGFSKDDDWWEICSGGVRYSLILWRDVWDFYVNGQIVGQVHDVKDLISCAYEYGHRVGVEKIRDKVQEAVDGASLSP